MPTTRTITARRWLRAAWWCRAVSEVLQVAGYALAGATLYALAHLPEVAPAFGLPASTESTPPLGLLAATIAVLTICLAASIAETWINTKAHRLNTAR